MIKINYQKEMNKIFDGLTFRPKLLLHSCCAPCSSSCLELLKKHFEITVYYYNPNIDTTEEYYKRLAEQKRLIAEMGGINIIEEDYSPDDFAKNTKGLESAPEGGERCNICIRMRMEKAAQYAAANGFDFFTTTLSVSPLKNAQLINQIGSELSKIYDIAFLFSDFKKGGGYLRSIELSRQFNLYRQSYCGCIFSLR